MFDLTPAIYNYRVRRRIFQSCLLLLLAGASPAWAQVSVCEASGTVVDADGNPIEGVVVTFKARANPATPYTGKTNKKGKYYISGLYTPKEADRWDVTVEKAGLVPTKMRVESRNVNKVLVGEVQTHDLRAGAKLPDIGIRPLGHAHVDLTLAAPGSAAAAAVAPAAAAPSAAPASPQADPWDQATALTAQGDLAGALPMFERAIEAQPSAPERHEAYAKVLYQLQRYDEALAAARKASALDPKRLPPRMMAYSIYASQKDWDHARSELESAAQAAPDDVRVLQQLAYVAGQQGQNDEMIRQYQRITQIDPANAEAWVALGGLYAKAGDMQRSEQAYQEVVKINPTQAYEVLYNLGAIIMNRNDRTDSDTRRAIDAFRKSLEIKPDYAQAQQQLGLALLNVGDQAGAQSALESYLRLNPSAPDAGSIRAILQSLSK